jgi:hypothetical protein
VEPPPPSFSTDLTVYSAFDLSQLRIRGSRLFTAASSGENEDEDDADNEVLLPSPPPLPVLLPPPTRSLLPS